MNTHLLTLCILPFVMLYTKCILLRRTGNTYTMYIYFNEFYKFYFYSNIYKETRMDRTSNIILPYLQLLYKFPVIISILSYNQ